MQVDSPFSLASYSAGSARSGRSVAFRALEVALSVTLVVQCVVAVGLAVAWLIPRVYDVAHITRIAHVSFLPWVPAALDAILASVVAAAGVGAAMGLWQDAWGRGRQVGRLKVQAAWTALLLQAACALFLILGADSPLGEVRIAPVAFLALGVVMAGMIVVLRSAAYLGLRWIRILAAALVVLLAAGGAVLGERAYAAHAATRALNTPVLPALPARAYPPESVVCAGSVTRSCARTAASRTGLTVAWADLGSNPRLALVEYAPANHVFQSLRLIGITVTLTSGSEDTRNETPPVRTVRDHGDSANVWILGTSAASFEWVHGGHHFQLFVLWSRGGVGPARMDAATEIWRSVKYAQPPTAGR